MRMSLLLLSLSLLSVHASATEKTLLQKPLPSAGVVLTFDDRNMNQWVKQIPLFQKYNAKVTFFVDHFHTLKPQQIDALEQLQAAGHAIGCHGAKHRKAVDYVREHGIERYLQDEITPAVKRMTKAGLKPIFVSPDLIKDTGCLIGTGIDYAGTEKRPHYLTEIKDAMDHAKQRGEIVIFYAHNISDKGPGHHIPPKALEEILAHAQEIRLPTLTYDDLP